MNRKWIGFAVAAALVATCVVGNGLSRAQDQEKHKETGHPARQDHGEGAEA